MNKKIFIRESDDKTKIAANPTREFRDGYQPSQQPTQQQSEENRGTNRPVPPSGGSGVPDKSN